MRFAIGDYKMSNYKLYEGFEQMMELIRNYQPNPADENQRFFTLRLWNPAVCFTLLLRKYLYQAMICGTNRGFLSDHNTFSDDPETVSDGITLRIDRLDNVGPKCAWSSDPSSRPSSSSSKRKYIPTLPTIVQDNGTWNVERDIFGSTLCRVEYNAAKNFPTLELPPVVFVKKYCYDRSWWKENNDFEFHEVPERDAYYDIFFNELKFNHTIAESQYASNFPKILCSGYWNGLGYHLVHIFEYLGQEMPEQEWDKYKVYSVIKDRLKEIHSLGISHNDIRIPNIHVSVSGKDFEDFDFIFGFDGGEVDNDIEKQSPTMEEENQIEKDANEEDLTDVEQGFEQAPPPSQDSRTTASADGDDSRNIKTEK
ncbi:uncharacterized protein RJT20DRAFT_134278 [Scheffersomyces xylosifermentans]|uniref:uncharacterized protein n=1 Tax=Scheffersomyces xylosifermentans TaxID=1304137 RepID=UPI00315C7660